MLHGADCGYAPEVPGLHQGFDGFHLPATRPFQGRTPIKNQRQQHGLGIRRQLLDAGMGLPGHLGIAGQGSGVEGVLSLVQGDVDMTQRAEFIARAVQEWLNRVRVKTLYIEPDSSAFVKNDCYSRDFLL